MKITVDTYYIARRLTTLMRVCNLYMEDKGNKFITELRGMLNLLKHMGIEHDIDWDVDTNKMTALIIAGERYELYGEEETETCGSN